MPILMRISNILSVFKKRRYFLSYGYECTFLSHEFLDVIFPSISRNNVASWKRKVDSDSPSNSTSIRLFISHKATVLREIIAPETVSARVASETWKSSDRHFRCWRRDVSFVVLFLIAVGFPFQDAYGNTWTKRNCLEAKKIYLVFQRYYCTDGVLGSALSKFVIVSTYQKKTFLGV